MPPISPSPGYSFLSLLPFNALGNSKPKSAEEVRFENLRWRWMGLAVASLVGYGMLIMANADIKVRSDDAGPRAEEDEEVDAL
jgi:hypothetical protein